MFDLIYLKKLSKDNRKNIVNKVSFLEGIQTGTEERTGCTENNIIRIFKILLLKFSSVRKIKIKNKDNIYNNIFVVC